MGSFEIIIGLAGGIGLFIFGMQMCSEGLQKTAAHKLKQLVKTLTNNPIMGVTVGAITTFALQSSSATSALVVGFIGAGMMSLSQALNVLLGSAIGSSLTAQIIAFKITELALLLIFVGANFYLFAKRSRQRSLGQSVLGLGLIFYGMFVMSAAVAPIREYPLVLETLTNLENHPYMAFLVAILISAIVQSSAAFLAIYMTLAAQHLIGPMAMIPFVLGSHLGGTVTGVLSSLGVPGRESKRAAVANFFFKLTNGLVFLPFYRPLTELAQCSTGDLSRQIANAHTFFSFAMVLGFLPFTVKISDVMGKWIPDKQKGLDEAVFLDESFMNLPDIAVDQAHCQTVEMGRLVETEMLNRVIPAVHYGNDELLDRINEVELAIDSLYKKISKYITGLGKNKLQDELMQKSVEILYVANDLEHIGDIMINVAKNVRKIQTEGLRFSEEGIEEIEEMFSKVVLNFNSAMKAFETGDRELATVVIKEHPKVLRLEKTLRYSHFDRMQCGNQKTFTTSSVHLDLIESLLRIDSHAVNIAQVVLGIV